MHLSARDLQALAERELGPGVAVDGAVLAEVAAAASATESGDERYPGVHVKAAALMTELMRRRPFERGNARVALLAALVHLNLNGFDVEASESDLAELAELAGRGNLSLLMVSAGFEAMAVPLEVPEPEGSDEEP